MTDTHPFLVGFVCAALTLTAATSEAGKKGVDEVSLDFNGAPRSYFLFVPDGIEAQQPAPLLLLLHGSGRDGMSLIDEWNKLAAKEGIVLLAPNAADERGWSSIMDGQDFLNQVITDVSKTADIDQQRLYIFGHSAGACYALGLALDAPDYYAAIAVHAGAITVDGIADEVRRTPISIQVGTNDSYFPVNTVRETRDAFDAAGFPIELVEIKGHTHWYYDSSKKINAHAWEFLSRHRLN